MFNIFKKNYQLTGKDFSRDPAGLKHGSVKAPFLTDSGRGLSELLAGEVSGLWKSLSSKLEGFTLVELMVSVSIFSIVMFISLGSILSILDANQKSKTLRSVMDNLNSAMESMTRTVRFGINYHCGSSGNTTLPQDCGDPGQNSLNFLSQDNIHVTYSLVGNCVAKSVEGGTNICITSPDIIMTKLVFMVYGSPIYNGGADLFQPQVIIVLSGYVGTKNQSKSTFSLQTTVTQRTIDFP